MSQPEIWGVPRSDGGQGYTPEQYANRDADSLDALLSLHKGPSRPSYATAGTMWLDDSATPWVVKVFDGTDDVIIGTINPNSNVFRADDTERLPLMSGLDGTTDINSLTEPGWQTKLYGTSNPNLPVEGAYWNILVLTFTSSQGPVTQVAFPYGHAGSLLHGAYIRGLYGGVWTAWTPIGGKGRIPIGFVYTQYPGEATPSSLFGGTWSLLFSNEGIFFRTEGGNASSFGGGIQGDELKSHNHAKGTLQVETGGSHNHTATAYLQEGSGPQIGGGSAGGRNATITTSTHPGHIHDITGSTADTGGAETRPRNRTIRIWKKTAH